MSENQEFKARDVREWITALQPLSAHEVSSTRNHFLLLAAWLYASERLEGLTPEEAAGILNDGFVAEDLMKKWHVDDIANAMDAVSLIMSSRIIEHIIKLINVSDISGDEKSKLIKSIYEMDVGKAWDVRHHAR